MKMRVDAAASLYNADCTTSSSYRPVLSKPGQQRSTFPSSGTLTESRQRFETLEASRWEVCARPRSSLLVTPSTNSPSISALFESGRDLDNSDRVSIIAKIANLVDETGWDKRRTWVKLFYT